MTEKKIVPPVLDHLVALSDDTGVIQHAVYDVPNRSTGYCTDDVSRALIVALMVLQAEPRNQTAARLASTYLSFLHDAQLEDGWFHNFMSFDRRWLDGRGTQDSFGRTMWALGYGMRFAKRDSWRKVCTRLFTRALPRIDDLEYLRPVAYSMLGLVHACNSGMSERLNWREVLRPLAARLKDAYLTNRSADWQWFDQEMTYDNSRLCEALLRAGLILRDDELIAIGLRTFAFYESVVLEGGTFVPIGSDGWYRRGAKRARYGQQPLEVAAMIDAALAAYDCTSNPSFVATAHVAYEWFHGKNTENVQMIDRGGSRDGIDPGRVNPNMGAESTLAYLASALALCERPAKRLTLAR